MRIDPVKQGENNRNVFGVIHLKGRLVYERGPRRGHSEGNRGQEGGREGRPVKEKKYWDRIRETFRKLARGWKPKGIRTRESRCGAKCSWRGPPGHALEGTGPPREVLRAESRDTGMEREAWDPGGKLWPSPSLWLCLVHLTYLSLHPLPPSQGP